MKYCVLSGPHDSIQDVDRLDKVQRQATKMVSKGAGETTLQGKNGRGWIFLPWKREGLERSHPASIGQLQRCQKLISPVVTWRKEWVQS